MPKPGMTRTEELVYTGFGSTGSALAGGAADIAMTFAGAIAVGLIGITVPILAVSGSVLSWIPGGTNIFDQIVNWVSGIGKGLIDMASDIVKGILGALGFFGGGGGAAAGNQTAGGNQTTHLIVEVIKLKLSSAAIAVKAKWRGTRIKVDLTRLHEILRMVRKREG